MNAAVRTCAALCLVSALAAGGCSTVAPEPKIKTRAVSLSVAPAANHDTAIAVDLVYSYNGDLNKQLTALSARDWFQKRDQLRLAFPSDLDVASFEVVPGQRGLDAKIEGRTAEAVGAFVFANYAGEGLHRARVDQFEVFAVDLGADDFAVTAVGPKPKAKDGAVP